MANKYAESIGNWEHKIGKITHVLVPQEDDNYEFLKIKDKSQKAESGEILHRGVGELYFKMVVRENPSMDGEEQASLKTWISVNINQIIEDFVVAMRWSTKEQLDSLKKKLNRSEEKLD